MTVLQTVKAPEQFIVDVNGDYHVCFDAVTVTVAEALASGTVLEDAATAATDLSTTAIGILAEDKPAGTAIVRVMQRGNPSLIDPAKISVKTEAILAVLEAKGLVGVK